MLTLSYLGLALDTLHIFGFEGGRDQHPDGGIPAQRSCPARQLPGTLGQRTGSFWSSTSG
jgi:hypothetical protein